LWVYYDNENRGEIMEALSIQIDGKVKKLLRAKAREHKRSMSKQAVYYIERGLQETGSTTEREAAKRLAGV